MEQKKLDKYGNDNEQESLADIHLFFPLSDLLIEPLHNMGLKPNDVTLLSTIFTIIGIYCFYKNNMTYCYIFYLLGYLMDTIDGRMARKYNQGSTLGMILDSVSDNVTNFPLMLLVINKVINSYNTQSFNLNLTLLIIIFIVTFVFGAVFGMNEAIQSYEKNKDDNFYKEKVRILKQEKYYNTCIGKIFLLIYKLSYQSYRKLFPYKINHVNGKNNLVEIKKKLLNLKEFGPGNYILFITYIMYMFSH